MATTSPFELALFDLVSPYVLEGDTFGQWHAALSVLAVSEYTMTADEAGIVIRGVALFTADVSPYVDPSKMTFGVNAENTEGHPANDPGRRDPWFDVRDAHINFELTAPRVASQKVADAVTAIGSAAAFAPSGAVLRAYDALTTDSPPSDYASTAFTLDLLLTTVVLRPPFLHGAKLDPSGILLDDPTHAQVKITLPKIKVRLGQGSNDSDPLTATLLSLGATGLDDQDDLGVAQLITMDPPYAFIGSSGVVGIGFRSATLDLSDGSTPPDVLSQFGFDDSWTGLYLPELRIYFAPQGAESLAFDASATNLLIGFGASAGITGDFEFEVINQGAGTVKLSARFYDYSGRCYAITMSQDGTTATVAIPSDTRLVVDIDGGLTPYVASAQIGTAADAPGRLFDVHFGTQPSLQIVVSAKGSQPGAVQAHLTITANLLPQSAAPAPGTAPTPGNPAVAVQTTSVTRGGSPVNAPALTLVTQTSSQATITLDADASVLDQTHWTVNGTDAGVSAIVTVDCAPGTTVQVQAVLPGATPGSQTYTAFYRFDHPKPNVEDPTAYSADADNTHSVAASNTLLTSAWPGGTDATSDINSILKDLDPSTAIQIEGYSSIEAGDDPNPAGNDWQYNNQLAANRAEGLKAIIGRVPGKTFTTVTAAADMSAWPTQGTDLDVRRQFWKAVAAWTGAAPPGTTTLGTVSRPSATPPVPVPVPDDPTNASAPPPPSWFKKMDGKVRIVRDHFVACELSGQYDIQTASENQLATGGGLPAGATLPQWGAVGTQNPGDGIIDVSTVVQIDDATDIVTVSVTFGADPADLDGLQKLGWIPPAPATKPDFDAGLTLFGLGIALWPLLSAGAGAVANDGAPQELAVTAGYLDVLGVLTATQLLSVQNVIWYGGEVDVQVRPDGTAVMLLLDLETAIAADISIAGVAIITIPWQTPLIVRYKAIGFSIGYPPGQPKFQFRPVFDSSKGYTLDVSKPGAIQVHDPFDKILKILGARLSRNNPTYLEVDLGFAIDLGVVTIDRARVRLNLSPGGPPELTAFGASVDIPDALSGKGYLEIGPDAQGDSVIKGGIDLTITPVCVRVAATLAIAQISAANGGPATGVQASLEVDFPVAIPLANSGLGIYGFIGLFAMNFARDMSIIPAGNVEAPELAWLKATNGEVSDPRYWVPKINSWAFGLGAILGTEGTSVIFNLKGMVLLELPGPQLLLVMKANVLAAMPDLGGTAEGTILAVIDLDFARETLTIGLAIQYSIEPLFEIQIPVEAFFDFNDVGDWHLYVGRYNDQVSATVFDVFDASGYLMLAGEGIPAHNGLPDVTGFSVAAGLHVSLTWGLDPLYARVAGAFDAVIGFAPFRAAGILTIRGTLHLFIIDISAWAELDVALGDDGHGGHIAQISGDICGEVDFFFFSVSGCVHFSLGGDAVPVPDPPPLLNGLKLVSRSPALVVGTGVDKPIDSSLGNAVDTSAAANPDANPGNLPVVPIDVVPALMMAVPPLQDGALNFLGQPLGGTPQAPADGWVQRGDVWYRYTLKALELVGALTAGQTPATWWNTKAGDQALEAQLALLSWVPDATPKALGSSHYLDETTTEKWGTVCTPVAPPAPVFWTFFFQILGPSDTGWSPFGLAYPDPAGTIRSGPPDLGLKVTERWRCGVPAIDRLRGIVPAEIEGGAVACPTQVPQSTGTGVGAGVLTVADRATVRRTALDTSLLRNPVSALRGGLSATGASQVIATAAPLTLPDVLLRFNAGQAVSRSVLTGLVPVRGTAPAATAPAPCYAWALASPLFDDGAIVNVGDPIRAGKIKAGWGGQFKPGPLDDAVVFDFGLFEYARFYLWIPSRLLELKAVVVAACDEHDQFFDQHIIVAADHTPPTVLPASWTSSSSPWEPAAFELEELAAAARRSGYTPVFVAVKGEGSATRVQIGCLPGTRQARQQITQRAFYVGAIEALKGSEVLRASYDDTEQSKKQGVLASALGLDSADNALLQANQAYEVKVTWQASRQTRKPDNSVDTSTDFPDTVQRFWFQTDASPPLRLDPWVLVALPGEAEQHYFAAESVRVVFATNNVGALYAAYGKTLQARLRPASFVPVPSTVALPHPLPLDPAHLLPVKAAVLSPWEAAAQQVVASTAPCVAVSGERIRHSMFTLAIPLDLYTDYLLDIEMVDINPTPASTVQRLWRGSFSTGGFDTLADFAQSFQITKVKHRGVHLEDINKLQALGPKYAGRPAQGAELDNDLLLAGLPALPVPKIPGVTVFWDPTTPTPQPAALLVDASEPMWRERPIPTLLTDPGPAAAQKYAMQSAPWLSLVPGIGDKMIDFIIPAPGGQRALVTLKPGSRGQRVQLALMRIAHTEPYLDGTTSLGTPPVILDLVLNAAPWEEGD